MTKFKKQSILSRINTSSFQSSTKLEALREEVHNMLHYDPSAKCIVFSQFTSMLDLVQYRLSQVPNSQHACPLACNFAVLFRAFSTVVVLAAGGHQSCKA